MQMTMPEKDNDRRNIPRIYNSSLNNVLDTFNDYNMGVWVIWEQ